MFKISLTIVTSVFLLLSSAADLFALEPFDDAGERISKKASPTMFQDLPDDLKLRIVSRAAFEQCLDNELPENLALVCEDWFSFIEGEMQEGKPCFKAWYGIFGHEDIYEAFVKGVLLFRPIPDSYEGMIEFPIAEPKDNSPAGTSRRLLKQNSLERTFDLSSCGNTGKSLIISIGYRKRINPNNTHKCEIHIAPHFMIEKKIANAPHFKDLMKYWDKNRGPVGVFYTWGSDSSGCFDRTHKSLDFISENNLHTIWHHCSAWGRLPVHGKWLSFEEQRLDSVSWSSYFNFKLYTPKKSCL